MLPEIEARPRRMLSTDNDPDEVLLGIEPLSYKGTLLTFGLELGLFAINITSS